MILSLIACLYHRWKNSHHFVLAQQRMHVNIPNGRSAWLKPLCFFAAKAQSVICESIRLSWGCLRTIFFLNMTGAGYFKNRLLAAKIQLRGHRQVDVLFGNLPIQKISSNIHHLAINEILTQFSARLPKAQ